MLKMFFFSSSQASALEGEIDLTKCFSVCECQGQRNYGFQIHVGEQLRRRAVSSGSGRSPPVSAPQTPNATHALSAMTAGIRQNWIRALMKNVHPGHAPRLSR